MYPNLKAEFARKGLTLEKIVAELDKLGVKMSVPTLSMKLNRKNKTFDFTLNEAKALKEVVRSDDPLEVLFEEGEEE